MTRLAQANDCAAIRRLFEQVDTLHATARPELFRAGGDAARTDEFILRLMASPTDALYVATASERVVGFALLLGRKAPDSPMFVPRSYVVVETLVVAADVRGQGIGRALMAQ